MMINMFKKRKEDRNKLLNEFQKNTNEQLNEIRSAGKETEFNKNKYWEKNKT